MPTILLTNDDGMGSPAIPPFARALARIGLVRVVVPDRERSWIGKAITRHDPVEVVEVEVDGIRMHTCTGYPADATQLGIHALFEDAPDLVVSGINVGINAGAGFLLSSGTVGAATEAWISGVGAYAFSTGSPTADWASWARHVRSSEATDDWVRVADVCTALLADLVALRLHEVADVVTVNLPWEATVDTARRVTSVARVGYDQLFRPDTPGRFVHEFGNLQAFEDLTGTDVAAFDAGEISITPLRMPTGGDLPEGLRAAIERTGHPVVEGKS